MLETKNTLQRSVAKKRSTKAENQPNKENKDPIVEESTFFSAYKDHVASFLIRNTVPKRSDFTKFVTLLYRGLFYSVNNLKGPSETFLKKKKVNLEEPANSSHKKILLLDLDETLIHSMFNSPEKADVTFDVEGETFRFNVRPHVDEFLTKMAKLFNVYVFTAGTQNYAEPIVKYLNKGTNNILGVLHRKNCMETQNGFFIKDLRIVSNRDLKDIIIVDNLVHSFGLQLSNGVPILEFINNKADKELLPVGDFLATLENVEDVRPVLEKQLKLTSFLTCRESEFTRIESGKV